MLFADHWLTVYSRGHPLPYYPNLWMTRFSASNMPSTDYHVPDGLTELLQEFTVAVLRNQPVNLNSFAKEYFERRCLNEESGQDFYNNNGYDEDEGTLYNSTRKSSSGVRCLYQFFCGQKECGCATRDFTNYV